MKPIDRARMGRPAPLLLAIPVVLILSTAFALYMRVPGGRPVSGETLLKIEKGMKPADVAGTLKAAGLVRDAGAFRLLARVTGSARRIKAGTYRIPAGASMGTILAMLVEGRQATEKVTIPEGYTTGMIARLLESRGIMAKERFLAAAESPELAAELGVPGRRLEGYLFPDTYRLPIDVAPEDAVRAMVGAFRKAVESTPELKGLDAEALHVKVVLASIVEREYRVAEEAPGIASVFVNRLAIGMPLQSCATVVYVIAEKMGKPHPSVVTYEDLAIRDPYNTYIHRGLPPGPIANPGITALRAAANPDRTDYLYFRLKDAEKGIHRFSRTLEEHSGADLRVKGL